MGDQVLEKLDDIFIGLCKMQINGEADGCTDGILTAYSRVDLEQDIEKNQFLRFWKNDPLRENFQNSVAKGFIPHRLTCYVQIS